jgi:hypothetical protein
LRPIVGNLRFDDDQVIAVARAPEAVLQQAAPGQSLDQSANLFVDVPTVGGKRAKRQAYAQFLRAIRRARSEGSQAVQIAIEAGDNFSIRLCFEPYVAAEPDEDARPRPSHSWSGSAQAGTAFMYGGESD